MASKRDAQTFAARVEDLLAARIGNGLSPELAGWAVKLPDAQHAQLARHELLAPRVAVTVPTLGGLVERFKVAAEGRVKPSTVAAYAQGLDGLVKHFGAGRPLGLISVADAEAWQNSMASTGLAKATRAKRVGVAKALFAAALRWQLVPASSFASLRGGSQANAARMHYVSPEDAAKLLDAAPSPAWRCIIALARFAGLRVPSELLDLRWGDVAWDRRALLVRSPKTAHHAGGAERTVPIVPELLAVLEAAFDAAPVGAVLIVDREVRRGSNLRTGFARIIARAGLAAWPRPLQNLRSSCECDFVQRFPAHEAARWMGHSVAMAARHYLQARDANFTAATGLATKAESAAQKRAQQAPETVCNGLQGSDGTFSQRPTVQHFAAIRTSTQNSGMGVEGFEPPKALANRFTVCPDCPLRHTPKDPSRFPAGEKDTHATSPRQWWGRSPIWA